VLRTVAEDCPLGSHRAIDARLTRPARQWTPSTSRMYLFWGGSGSTSPLPQALAPHPHRY